MQVPLVLFGVSRGSAATFNALATHPELYLSRGLRLVILEGIFTSIEDVFRARYGVFADMLLQGLERVTKFERNGPSPRALVDKLPPAVPIAFITSEADTEVPAKLTKELYELVAARGQNPTHLLVLKHSSHSQYALAHPTDRSNYMQFVHQLYAKYGLPHHINISAPEPSS